MIGATHSLTDSFIHSFTQPSVTMSWRYQKVQTQQWMSRVSMIMELMLHVEDRCEGRKERRKQASE